MLHHLKRSRKATDTKFFNDKGILLRYRAKDLVGVTVLNASYRANHESHGLVFSRFDVPEISKSGSVRSDLSVVESLNV